MKKKNRIIGQRATAFALSLTVLNAAEQGQAFSPINVHQAPFFEFARPAAITLTKDDFINQLSEGISESDKVHVIDAVESIKLDCYTDAFVNAVNKLTQGMNGRGKSYVIYIVEKVSPDRYAAFINTVDQLLQGMDRDEKVDIIDIVGKIPSDLYTDAFTNTVNQLSQEMNGEEKSRIIDAVENVSPDLYTDAFINTVNQLSQGMDSDEKVAVIDIVEKVSPDNYTAFINAVNQLPQEMFLIDKLAIFKAFGKFSRDHYTILQNFIEVNPRYFQYVPALIFCDKIKPNMTQQRLEGILLHLQRQYHSRALPDTPLALAFRVHTYARQTVVDEAGQKQKFNIAVLEHIRRSIEGSVLDYKTVLDLLRAELKTLKDDPLTSGAINDEVYNWVIESNKEQQDKNAIDLVVTYLEQKDKTHKKLSTWLYAFMEESQKAYKAYVGGSSRSCIKGVKERVITSLRSAVPQGDNALGNLFKQAESTFMFAAKSMGLTDYAFLAQKLLEKGVTSITPQDVAKGKFSEFLHTHFGGGRDAAATIKATLDAFEDSEPYYASLRLSSGDGLWSKIKAELIKLEQEETKDRTCCAFFKKIALFFGYS
ncbi:MAG: hypothetical protein NEHIOOID_00975 [Holosporales bacterium]